MNGGPEMNRTSDTTFRKRVLYPLSYGATAINSITQSALRTKENISDNDD